MERSEIVESLENIQALKIDADGTMHLDSQALMQDPIVANRMAVELLQKIDRDAKPELVLSQCDDLSYFGYSVALSAWMRFGYCRTCNEGTLVPTADIKKKEKVIIVLDTFDEALAQQFIDLVVEHDAKPVAVLSVVGGDDHNIKIPHFSLL